MVFVDCAKKNMKRKCRKQFVILRGENHKFKIINLKLLWDS